MSSITVQQQQNDRRTGAVATIVLHIIMVLLFLFFGLQQPDPLPEEEMVELVFEDAGGLSGGDPDPNPGNPQESATPVTAPAEPEEVATEDDGPVEVPKPVKPQPKPTPKPETPKPPKPNPNALFTPSTSPSTAPSDGPPGGNNTPGDKPGGGGIGSFSGKGFNGRLEGRGFMKGPNISDRPPIDRRTVVALFITVDRQGRVTNARENLNKSNTTRVDLFNISKKGAMEMLFSAKPDGPFEQQGEITFVFEPQ